MRGRIQHGLLGRYFWIIATFYVAVFLWQALLLRVRTEDETINDNPSTYYEPHMVDDYSRTDTDKATSVSINASQSNTTSRIIILSVWTHYPDLLELHVMALRKFLTQSFDYVCVLNSHDPQVNAVLLQTAERLQKVTPLSINVLLSADASHHHSHALNLALHQFLLLDNHDDHPLPSSSSFPLKLRDNDILFLLDSDIFPMVPLHIQNDVLGSFSVLSIPQTRNQLVYLWPNFCLLRLPNVAMYRDISFSPVVAQVGMETFSMDSGGATFHFLQKYSSLESQWTSTTGTCSMKTTPSTIADAKISASLRDIPPASSSGASPDGNQLCPWFIDQVSIPSHTCRTPELILINGRAMFYHLGSAGSNWRRCPEDYLLDRRRDLHTYIHNCSS